MQAPRLSDECPAHAWALRPWTYFRDFPRKEESLIVLPLHGLEDRGPALPYGMEERLGAALLRAAVSSLPPELPLLCLPPLRQLPPTGAASILNIDFETALSTGLSLARAVREAGFGKLVLLNTSEGNTSFASTLALEARASLGLSTYVIHGDRLGLRPECGETPSPALAATLCGLLLEIAAHRRAEPVAHTWSPSLVPAPVLAQLRPERFADLTPHQLQELADQGAPALLATSAIEQHGFHLPVGVDALLAEAWTSRIAALLPHGRRFVAAPPLLFGNSPEHAGFPGTISIGATAMHRSVNSLLDQLVELGFTRPALLNTHGGNRAVLDQVLRARVADGHRARLLRCPFQPALPPHEQAWGMHADEWETSLMLALSPELVDLSKAVSEYPIQPGAPGLLRPEKAPATHAWLTRDFSSSGVIGDPRSADAGRGLQWFEEEAKGLLEALLAD